MPVLLVAYEIHPHEETASAEKLAADRRSAIREFVERHNGQRLSESAYAIDVTDPVHVFAETVLKMAWDCDELYVIPLAAFHAPLPALFSCGPGRARTWLLQRLRPPA
ncbi:hypothetical protein [Sorangium cellulosum]|uniref:Uncharacterized protein n=1 Tax=Sorangium cellulosum TaxID=56 RepID=A0A150QNS3_SORCE|nr:hypothetical protein [Sorangium cellulosum]KYF69655.1 hypothetical protein BE15_25720 [Sorangium cellulosum]